MTDPLTTRGDEMLLVPEGYDFDLQFSDVELAALGDITGLQVLHLGPEGPQESIALAGLGATVVAVDVPEPGSALDYIESEQLPITLVGLPLSELSDAERDHRFDVVYCGPATLSWVENLNDWVVDVAEALVPGGKLVMYDEHPSSRLLAPANETPEGEILDTDLPGAPDDWAPVDQSWSLDELSAELRERGLLIDRLDELHGFQRFLTTAEMLGQAEGGTPTAFVLVARSPRA